MLSDFKDSDKTFSFSLDYSNTKTGRSRYQSYILGASFRPCDWFLFSAALPYNYIRGKEVIFDETAPGVERRNEFSYSNDGIGDIVLMAWTNVAHPFLRGDPQATGPFSEENPGEEVPKRACPDPCEGTGQPGLYFGLGVKLATGSDDEFDFGKYAFDRSKAVTGEMSKSDGVVPSRFQLGTGTYDLILGIVYQQRFGRVTPYAGLSWQFPAGENSVEYERSDRFFWSAGTEVVLYTTEDNRQLTIRGGISGVTSTSNDIDRSEDTTLLGSQIVGKVPGTRGTYNYLDFGLGYNLTENFTVYTQFRDGWGDTDVGSEDSFDWQFSIGLRYSF